MKPAYITLILIGVLFLFGKIFNKKMFTEQDARTAILKLKDAKGAERARLVEQMMRLETNHFRSEQYRNTGSAGMEAGAWGKYLPKSATNGTYTATDNQTLKPRSFIVWRSVSDFAQFLSDYIDRHNGNFAQWNTTNPTGQAEYRARVLSITPRFL